MTIAVRPRFRLEVEGSVEEQMERLRRAATDPGARCVHRVVGQHVDITVIPEDRHRWSPCVQMELRQTEEGTVIDGLVGPHPNVWTFYAFVNFTLVVVVAFGLMIGVVQIALGMAAWGLWMAVGGGLVIAGMYAASQVGRRLAAEQTEQLRTLVDGALHPDLRPVSGRAGSGAAGPSEDDA